MQQRFDGSYTDHLKSERYEVLSYSITVMKSIHQISAHFGKIEINRLILLTRIHRIFFDRSVFVLS